MKIKELKSLDLKLYEHTLDNGFRIFIIPMKTSNTYVTLSTKYGSVNNEFVPYDSNEMKSFPLGIAHFLEHKMFEQKDGVDPFEFFASNGADANANTTSFKTTYLFSGTKCYRENLNYLLDYVYSPYFTDENVEKEKGIIEQEIKMYEDDPYSAMYENMLYNTFITHPLKYKVIGNIESVRSITKEDLYACYNTFYHPSNMYLVVTGNVKPKETIDIVQKYMSKKDFGEKKKIVIKKYDEPNKVAKKNETIKMNIAVPKVGIGYKINVSKINMSVPKIRYYISMFFEMITDATSSLNEELLNQRIINCDLASTQVNLDGFMCFYILSETRKTNTLIKMVDDTIKSKPINKKDFERKKKAIIANLIKTSDNLYAINNKIMSNIITYDKAYTNYYDLINKLNYNEFKKIINEIDLSNTLTYTIKPN